VGLVFSDGIHVGAEGDGGVGDELPLLEYPSGTGNGF
jgi:hypothetical protein